MSKFFIEAYNKQSQQILGNGFGQGSFEAKEYKKTKIYKALFCFKHSNVAFYRIVRLNAGCEYLTIETIFVPELQTELLFKKENQNV